MCAFFQEYIGLFPMPLDCLSQKQTLKQEFIYTQFIKKMFPGEMSKEVVNKSGKERKSIHETLKAARK